MSKFSDFVVKSIYFKWSLNNINGNLGPLVSQTNFDQTYFFWGGGVCSGGFWHGDFSRGFLSRGLYPRTQFFLPLTFMFTMTTNLTHNSAE